ncbi:efflux RND transporter periplasmic adaptor subunit [candidate division KSB1 bacterium]|nr:efflux RND transporter periplasmic adaptor subunit [candidate division KSB1 bacterium]
MKQVLCTLLALIILAACNGEKPTPVRDRVIPVRVATVNTMQLTKPITTAGQLVSDMEARLSFKIGGIVDHIYVREGDRVRKGQLLAALKSDEIKAQVQQARSAMLKAERDFNRVKNLYSDSVATLEQFQDTETALTMARARLEIAEFNLEHARILAPAEGRILKQLAESGELVAAGQPLFLFGSTGRHWNVRAGVAGRDIVGLAPGDPVDLIFDELPHLTLSGEISEIAASADPMTGTFAIEVSLKSAPAALKNGFIARLTIRPGSQKAYWVVPLTAIVEADGPFAAVYVPTKEGKVSKQPVTIAFIGDDGVALQTGMEGVDRVVTDGAAYCRDGSSIEIITQ